MSGALHVGAEVAEKAVERLLGPDGTPFGSLPTQGKGVGLLAHATTMYRHIKAEQDAGHRSKGFAEKHIERLLQKSTENGGKGMVEEEELLIEKNRSSRDGRSGRNGGRRRRHRSKSRRGEEHSKVIDRPVHEPVQEAGSSGVRQGTRAPSQSGRSVQQSTPFVEQPPGSVPPPMQSSRQDDNSAFAPVLEREEVVSSRGADGAASVRVQPPAPPASVREPRAPTPSVRGAPSIREVGMGNAGGSRSTSRVPTIRVQSPTPPKQANSTQSPTPPVREIPSRFQSPEPEQWEPAHPVRSPAPSQHVASPPPMSTPPPAMPTPCPATPSVVDMPTPTVAVAPPMPPPPPPPPPHSSDARPSADPTRDAFLASIQLGVKLKKVNDEDRKDASAARKDEARIEDATRQTPVYEETPHSHDVEALEHAQAVEEKERKQEEERAARTKTPFIAPQPRMKMPANFQDELAAKLGKVKLNEQRGDGASEAGPSETLNVVKPRASNETWRTVFSDNEGYSEPNQAFRERLGNTLSAGATPRPPTAATTRDSSARCVYELICEHWWVWLAIWTKLGLR